MIHAIAVDPDVIIDWCKNEYVRKYFIKQFGIGTPRIIAGFPKKNKIRKKLKQLILKGKINKESLEYRKYEIFLDILTETVVFRNYQENEEGVKYDKTTWIENTINEHERLCSLPFHKIITKKELNLHSDKLTIYNSAIQLMSLLHFPHGKIVKRNADDMAEAVGCLLKNAIKIMFIDPYFTADNTRFQKTLKAFCKQISVAYYTLKSKSQLVTVEIICSADIKKLQTKNFFKTQCDDKKFKDCFPKGLEIVVKRYKKREGKPKMHNRYILTDIGGITFSHGLDESTNPEEIDDIYLLTAEQYRQRWNQYVKDESNQGVFDLDLEVKVVGTK